MRIGIDVSMIDESKAGIGYYAYSLIDALAQIDTVNQYYLFTFNKLNLSDLKLSPNFEVIEVEGKGNLKWMLACLPKIRSLKLDQFLSPSNLFWGCVLKNCTTVIHDIAQILHPEFFYKKGNLFYRIELSLLLRRTGVIITPSKAVKQEIISNYKKIKSKIFTVTEGLHGWTLEEPNIQKQSEIKNKYVLPEKYLLTVGTLEPRKNLIGVIGGFKEFLKGFPEYKLVIVGKKGWFYDEIFKFVTANQMEDKIIFLGYVPDTDLSAIYDLSAFVVSLSFYEGFGLPLIEANARNKAILASNIEVYRELEISGSYIDLKSNTTHIAEKMENLLNFEFVKKENFFDIYSWKNAAEQILNIWHK